MLVGVMLGFLLGVVSLSTFAWATYEYFSPFFSIGYARWAVDIHTVPGRLYQTPDVRPEIKREALKVAIDQLQELREVHKDTALKMDIALTKGRLAILTEDPELKEKRFRSALKSLRKNTEINTKDELKAFLNKGEGLEPF